MPILLFITLLVAAPITLGGITGNGSVAFIALALVLIVNPIIWKIRKDRYFNSEQFQELKSEIASVVAEHNDIVDYVAEIRSRGSLDLGASSTTGQYVQWNNRRDRNVAEYAPHVHNTSLQVVRNAGSDPIKYLMKCFSIKADQETLADVQRVAEDISRLEEAVANVKGREAAIAARVNPPAFILKRYAEEFWTQVGARLSPITRWLYPQYLICYPSQGYNNAHVSRIDLDTPTLEALSEKLVEKIHWAKSGAGQRALMTARLRDQIKERDRYTCLKCGVSVAADPHLLLEVDHIRPVSEGGLSTPENLQTLCWRCNRSKGAKVVG